MQVKIKTEKTVWIGMSDDQRGALSIAIVGICKLERTLMNPVDSSGFLTDETMEVLDDLRQALLSV